MEAVLSPDGSRVAFLKGSANEIWVMGPKGENARRVASAGDGFFMHDIAWSPDGRFVASLKNLTANLMTSIVEVHDLAGGPAATVLATPRISSLTWTADGRLLYAQGEPPPKQESYGLWELALDPRTAKPVGSPRQLATWLSQSVLSISASRDGRRVMVTRGRTRGNIYVGELGGTGSGLSNLRQLTKDDRVNWPSGWMPGGRSVLFSSDRNGGFRLFEQGPADREASLLQPGPGEARAGRVTADGRWLLYLATTGGEAVGATGLLPARLMRVPVSGGPPETVLETAGDWGRGEGVVFVDGDYTWSVPQFRCPANAEGPCVVGEAGARGQTVLTAFDPSSGRKAEIARLDGLAQWISWDLSPDGSHIAYASSGFFGTEGQAVNVLNLADRTVRRIPLGPWRNPSAVAWSPSGTRLFVSNFSVPGGALIDLDLSGHARVLLDMTGKGVFIGGPYPSPDGKQVAFAQVTAGANAWLLEAAR